MVFAIVKPEVHFVKVGLQMLCANTMPVPTMPRFRGIFANC